MRTENADRVAVLLDMIWDRVGEIPTAFEHVLAATKDVTTAAGLQNSTHNLACAVYYFQLACARVAKQTTPWYKTLAEGYVWPNESK